MNKKEKIEKLKECKKQHPEYNNTINILIEAYEKGEIK